jgi:hypothetical protein
MPGIPIFEDQTYDNRTLPLEAAPIPAVLADRQVIAFAFTPARRGEHPNQAVAVVREDDRPILRAYAVLRAAAPQDGQWTAFGGTYDCSYVNAMEIFREDLNSCT